MIKIITSSVVVSMMPSYGSAKTREFSSTISALDEAEGAASESTQK